MFWLKQPSAASPSSRLKPYVSYVENNEWQIGEIQAALQEADAGDFATDKDVVALAKKWKVNAR